MSATTIHAGAVRRPVPLVAAVVLTLLAAVVMLATLPVIPDDAPDAIAPISIVAAILLFVGALGLWQGLRWAAILTFVVTILNGLSAAPGIVFAEDAKIQVFAALSVVQAVAVCWLLLRKTTRAALR